MATTIKGLSINRENQKLDVQFDARMFHRDSEGIISLVGMEAFHAYGVEWDDNNTDPDCVRIGNMDLHRTLPVQSMMRGCLLDDNGNVVMYLPTDDWTSSVRDGSMGQVMVEMPRHFRKFVSEGTKHQVWLSLYPIDGYHEVPKMYVGAYEASLQRSTNKLCSVFNWGEDYRGGDNSSFDLLAMPVTSLSLTQFRRAARNRNQSTTEWNCYTYECHKAITWLFVVEYATRNSQKAYNAQPTTEGYKQGGLGIGFTNIDSAQWYGYNGYRPLCRCGATDYLGNNTGEYTYEGGSPLGYATCHIPRYRGIEHPFGHIWKWVDGVLIVAGDPDSSYPWHDAFICSDPSKFNDSDTSGYSYIGASLALGRGYISQIFFGEDGEILPKLNGTGGSSSTSWCDYYYTTAGAYTRGVLFGGDAVVGSRAGFACADSGYVPSFASTNVGSRLCFIPR